MNEVQIADFQLSKKFGLIEKSSNYLKTLFF